MISSGMKRGLAATAISALAVTGLPFFANSASATPLDTQSGGVVQILSPEDTNTNADGVSTKFDGTNDTVSLVAVAPSTVTTILFQYKLSSEPGTAWKDINGVLSRNADGAFTTEWAMPALAAGTSIDLRAVPDVGAADTDTVFALGNGAGVYTVELSTEGALGIFQAHNGNGYVAVHGTTSDPATNSVAIYDQLNHVNGPAVDSVKGDDGVSRFKGVLTYGPGQYPYSTGSEANQVAISAAIGYPQTTDTEASTLYIQKVTSVTAVPKTTDLQGANTTSATVTVLDQNGKPVAGALVRCDRPVTPATTPPSVVTKSGTARTDADGKATVSGLDAGTWTCYADLDESGSHTAGDVDAAPFTLSSYTPAFSSITIKNERNRTAFDLDEFLDTDDFSIVFADQKGAPYQDPNVDAQYRYVITPADGSAPITTDWFNAADNGDGTYQVQGPKDGVTVTGDVPVGSYQLEARRPNFNGTGLTTATPVTFTAGESEITFDEGASAQAPVNGTTTVSGKLALVGDGSALGGRAVPLTYSGTTSGFAPQSEQPAGVTVSPSTGGAGSTATAITAADGTFSVKLNDQKVPANVTPIPENATLTAGPAQEAKSDTTSLKGDNGPGGTDGQSSDATGTLAIHWAAAPVVGRIAITSNTLDPRNPTETHSIVDSGPGVPVDLDITVYAKDNDSDPTNDVALSDQPVNVAVSKGFLSPNAESANDAKLAAGHDANGDLWGFFENDGAAKDVKTGDAGAAGGAVVAIEKDADFDDDGLTDITVTVKSGDVTKTMTITMDDRVLLNQTDSVLKRSADSPQGDAVVGQHVDFNLYVHDQFGNLVGDQFAKVTDDSTVADVTTDANFGETRSDFVNDSAAIRATSSAPTTQTLNAAMSPGQVLVEAKKPASSSKSVNIKSDPINWVAAPPVQHHIHPGISAKHVPATDTIAGYDRITVNAGTAGADAVVSLYRVKDGVAKKVKSKVLGTDGKAIFKRADLNGDKVNYYFAKVSETATNFRGRTDTTSVK